MTAEEIIQAWSAECLAKNFVFVRAELERAGIPRRDANRALARHFEVYAQSLRDETRAHTEAAE